MARGTELELSQQRRPARAVRVLALMRLSADQARDTVRRGRLAPDRKSPPFLLTLVPPPTARHRPTSWERHSDRTRIFESVFPPPAVPHKTPRSHLRTAARMHAKLRPL